MSIFYVIGRFRDCGNKVGFNIQRVIRNPLAACLAYDIEEDNSQNMYLEILVKTAS